MGYGNFLERSRGKQVSGAWVGGFGVSQLGRDPISQYPGWVTFRASEVSFASSGFHGGIYILASAMDKRAGLDRLVVVESENLSVDLYRLLADPSRRSGSGYRNLPTHVRIEEILDKAVRAKRAQWWESRDPNMLTAPDVSWDIFRTEG